MGSHRTRLTYNGIAFDTLEDILPPACLPLRMLIVGKTPTPRAVEIGHYHQGQMGKMMWRILASHGIFNPPAGAGMFEDDVLSDQGLGITDVVKRPHDTGDEPSQAEYVEGAARIGALINQRQPQVVCFVYKKALDQVLNVRGGMPAARYGLNPGLGDLFGASLVFAFPMPGTPATRAEAKDAMLQLRCHLHYPAYAVTQPRPLPRPVLGSDPQAVAADVPPTHVLAAAGHELANSLAVDLARAAHGANLAGSFTVWAALGRTATGPVLRLFVLPYRQHEYQRLFTALRQRGWPCRSPCSAPFPIDELESGVCLPVVTWERSVGPVRHWHPTHDAAGLPALGMVGAGLFCRPLVACPWANLPPAGEDIDGGLVTIRNRICVLTRPAD